jgi:hypothetical protein
VLAGLCIGQVNLIALWASLAPGNIVLRVSWSLLLMMAMWYGLMLGMEMVFRSHGRVAFMTRSDAIVLLVVLFSGVAILQIPLWIAKKVFRWRLTRRPDDSETSLQEDRQFHLQHLMVATVFVALALSPLHQVLPAEPGTFRFEGEMLLVLGVAIFCNFVMTIPCVWWAFASTARLIPLLLGWSLYCGVLTLIEFGFFCTVFGLPHGHSQEIVPVFYVLNLSQCVAVLGTLWILRAIGFRMVRMPRAGRPMGASPFQTIVQTEQP